MKKLIQLLNEYQTQRGGKFKFSSYDINSNAFIIDKNPRIVLGEETITCKKFWFIKWLVGMAKIDYEAWHKVFIDSNYFDNISDLYEYEVLTMYLSIQDDPISFLISILK